jgi:hypothetical protein
MTQGGNEASPQTVERMFVAKIATPVPAKHRRFEAWDGPAAGAESLELPRKAV